MVEAPTPQEFQVVSGPHAGETFRLGPVGGGGDALTAWSLGRAQDAAIALVRDPFVSRRQAVLRLQDGRWTVMAWQGTTNPTRLNGQMLSPGIPVPLEQDDVLQVGRSELVCHLWGARGTLAPPFRDRRTG